MDPSRRSFLKGSAASAVALSMAAEAGSPSAAAQDAATVPAGAFQPAPGKKFDLLIKGGEVIDPSRSVRGRRDVAIHNGRIAAVESDIAADRATQMVMANGQLVVPGLVDMHSHVYPLASGIGLPADELVPRSATTTYVSAGDAGSNNFGGFRPWVIGQ